MKYSLFLLAPAMLLLHSCNEENAVPYTTFAWNVDSTNYNLAKYVDPMIGTDGHGHTFPGACAPFGMVQLSPDTRIDGSWDGCSGYHYSDDTIYGFSHTHLSGTGCSDYGDIMFMPGIEELRYTNGTDGKRGYAEGFSHDNENASAGYYKVQLNNAVTCEMTASPRVGVHKYTFPNGNKAWIVLDMSHRDEVLECELEIVDDHTIRGKRFSKAWATNQQLWFYAEFSKPFKHTMWSEGNTFSANSCTVKDLKVVFEFGVALSEPVEVKVALSPVSWENAKLNMQVETQNNWFDWVRTKTLQHWESELGRIEVTSDDVHKLRTFYTALYHCFIAPNVYCDVNGDYRGMDHQVYRDTVHQRYTVFSLWDTYRALHPLFTIIQQKRTNDFINTFLQQYKESGRLPVWELSSNETDCMIGYHSIPVIADAWLKGINDFDTALAYEAMKASALGNRFGLPEYRNYGFIPAEGESESVSKTLEYAYDDWCISQIALHMKNNTDAEEFSKRASNWRNLFDPKTNFFRARMNNSFTEPFQPGEVNFHYTEANAWQYSMAVQHDITGLVQQHDNFEIFLDSLFSVSSKTTGREQADITGLIGQYAQGNEPSHHMAYLYNYSGNPGKTQKLITRIVNEQYSDTPDGLCGNEDCGQMSAWYVLSTLGIYPVNPCGGMFDVGKLQVDSAVIHFENGHNVLLKTGSELPRDEAVQAPSISLGMLQYFSTIAIPVYPDTVNSYILASLNPQPYEIHRLPAPVIISTSGSSRTFTDKRTIELMSLHHGTEIYLSVNNKPFEKYTHPFVITDNSEVRAYATLQVAASHSAAPSDTAIATYTKAPSWKSIAIRNAYAPQYSAGGDRALIDGLTGTTNFRTGLWQGYEGVEMDVVIDLGKSFTIDSISVNFLQDEQAWIFLPTSLMFEITDDTTKWEGTGIIIDKTGAASYHLDDEIKIENHVVNPNKKGRFVRLTATNKGTCPPGHPGEGKPAWLFADEITVKTK